MESHTLVCKDDQLIVDGNDFIQLLFTMALVSGRKVFAFYQLCLNLSCNYKAVAYCYINRNFFSHFDW